MLDRFISASLGRPLAIPTDMAYGESLNIPLMETTDLDLSRSQVSAAAMTASVESAHTIGETLDGIYLEHKVSVKVAQRLFEPCRRWPSHLARQLRWQNAHARDVHTATAIRNCNVLFSHSIVLLTRPFFLHSLHAEVRQTRPWIHGSDVASRRTIERFSDACIMASFHTVALVRTAYEGGYLPRLDPFSSYCLFTSGLIIAANEFAWPGKHAGAHHSIEQCIAILHYCGRLDTHAQAAARVMDQFRDVIRRRALSTAAKDPYFPDYFRPSLPVPLGSQAFVEPLPASAMAYSTGTPDFLVNSLDDLLQSHITPFDGYTEPFELDDIPAS